jgi:hypothetical protein
MAAECARNALVEKVVDNKEDSGNYFPFQMLLLGDRFTIDSVAFEYIVIIYRKIRYKCILFHNILYMDFLDCAEKFRLDLMNIARTTLSSKIVSQDKEHFAKLAVDAVMRLKVNGDYPTNNDSSFGGFSK